MTAPSRRLSKRSRKAPSPNSILDRKALVQALDAKGLNIKATTIDSFYGALHRQHYPELSEFVKNYYAYEERAQEGKYGPLSEDNLLDKPLKNAITNRRNRNRKQLPKALLQFLSDTDNGFVTITSTVVQRKTSSDGTTTKLAVRLHDGQVIESVLMRYITVGGSRASLCVSSQCGCAMGCTFCATGTMGLSGNLTTGEILEQIVHADGILAEEWMERKENRNEQEPLPRLDLVRNVVFMGMGEPLDNYENVIAACRALTNRKRWNLAHGRVTISTVGIVSQMRKLTKELPEVSLAVSLHAPNQELRTAIVPTAKRYQVEDLINALDEHMMTYRKKRKDENGVDIEFTEEERIQESTRRRAMIEYVMLEGETSSFESAHQLGKLCENRHLIINLIPYNQTDVKDKLRCPSEEHVQEFRRIVASYGNFCTVRRTMGADIDSACGQLVRLETKKEAEKERVALGDIEEVASPRTVEKEQKTEMKVSRKEIQVLPGHVYPKEDKGLDERDLEQWIRPLTIATTIAASTFLLSAALFLRQRRR